MHSGWDDDDIGWVNDAESILSVPLERLSVSAYVLCTDDIGQRTNECFSALRILRDFSSWFRSA
jgi:hypothetical protein